ncbi:DHRS1 [Bugula neritina]|uniref:DHRS1 n=1 Tax=Bugula neritina TaxID=10212 RepID=A0A7J7JPS0_BUGNE|nr:DHRS1 [Bugula neritina]
MALSGKVCLVTGSSRGLGKGIAVQLGEAGATVYVTGRSSSTEASVVGGSLKETATEIDARGGKGIAVVCDHSNDEEVKALFTRIKQDHGRLDVLVNNAYAAVTAIFKSHQAGEKFWQKEGEPGRWWDLVNGVGLRNHYICSAYAAQMMVEAKSGAIFNVSSFGGKSYLFDVAYGIGKAAVDRMSADMAVELKEHGVPCVTIYPGAVLTELITHSMKADDSGRMEKIFSKGESPEFSGKAVVALASDPKLIEKTGKVLVCAEVAKEYGFTDIDGSSPPSRAQV